MDGIETGHGFESLISYKMILPKSCCSPNENKIILQQSFGGFQNFFKSHLEWFRSLEWTIPSRNGLEWTIP